MYAQIFLVTSVRGAVFTPQIAANGAESFFGAKMPFPAFFMEAASFLPLAFFAVLPRAFLVALRAAFVGFVALAFVVMAASQKSREQMAE